MNLLLEISGQEPGWKSELEEHATGYSAGKGFWMGWGWKADSRVPISSFGNRYGPRVLNILLRQLEFEIVNMHVDELQTPNDSHNDVADPSE